MYVKLEESNPFMESVYDCQIDSEKITINDLTIQEVRQREEPSGEVEAMQEELQPRHGMLQVIPKNSS